MKQIFKLLAIIQWLAEGGAINVGSLQRAHDDQVDLLNQLLQEQAGATSGSAGAQEAQELA